MSASWRFIDSGLGGAAFNMALDEALSKSVRAGISPPVLRLYGWEVLSVSIGCFQKTGDIDIGYCASADIPCVRRPTGGRALLHGDEITYSFSAGTTGGLFSRGLFDSYRKISLALGDALLRIGLKAELKLLKDVKGVARAESRKSSLCFSSVSYGEVSVDGSKIIGSAQKRWADGFLQQGSIPMHIDMGKTARVFRMPASPESSRRMRGLRDIDFSIDAAGLKNHIRSSFEEFFGVSFVVSVPSMEEMSLAYKLESQKYSSGLWTFNR